MDNEITLYNASLPLLMDTQDTPTNIPLTTQRSTSSDIRIIYSPQLHGDDKFSGEELSVVYNEPVDNTNNETNNDDDSQSLSMLSITNDSEIAVNNNRLSTPPSIMLPTILIPPPTSTNNQINDEDEEKSDRPLPLTDIYIMFIFSCFKSNSHHFISDITTLNSLYNFIFSSKY